jgi:hypothetical protein
MPSYERGAGISLTPSTMRQIIKLDCHSPNTQLAPKIFDPQACSSFNLREAEESSEQEHSLAVRVSARARRARVTTSPGRGQTSRTGFGKFTAASHAGVRCDWVSR